ncbi:MAG TPA: lysophospholipid acyltransferase family protein [Acidobacteriota bacterium]
MNRRLHWRRRALLPLAGVAGPPLIRLLGSSQRWQAEGLEQLERARAVGKPLILVFWHEGILMATYRFRHRNIAVMTSRNYDGELIARIITRLGYVAVRGSSSAGASVATRELVQRLAAGQDIGFAIDGPRGPRRRIKPGAVFTAQLGGAPLVPFTVALRRPLRLRSWDRFQIPRPFSTARLLVAAPILVGPGPGEQERASRELQQALDRLEERAAVWDSG